MSQKSVATCKICQKEPSKYKCPGCQTQTCSVECVKSHKKSMECDGKRKLVSFVKLKEFSYKNIVDDMSFLESTARKVACVESPKGAASGQGSGGKILNLGLTSRRKAFRLDKLKKAASLRQIHLRLSPFMTTRRRGNTTYCTAGDRAVNDSTKMFWHIRWVYGDCMYEDTKVDEGLTIEDLLNRMLSCQGKYTKNIDDETLGRLAVFSSMIKNEHQGSAETVLNDLTVGLEAEHMNKPKTVYVMDKSSSIRQNLKGKTIIEHPILHIIPQEKLSEYAQL